MPTSDTRRVVAVLGGNAFASADGRLTMEGQLQFADEAMQHLAPLLSDDVELLISHGNGPQVGHILTRVEAALGQAYTIPLEVCVAESEGELGYVLQQAIHNQLASMGSRRRVAALLTQVLVDGADPQFSHPSKPVGPFYDAPQAEAMRSHGLTVVEDSGRGFRRVVPSPAPLQVLDWEVIDELLRSRRIVIAAGGGGVPVVEIDGRLHGVEAVIDKDLTACLLADLLGAEQLIILTCVAAAYRDFGAAQERAIGRVTASELQALLADGHFAPGSMQPKIEAAIRFVARPGRTVIICDPPSLVDALAGKAGTIVIPNAG